MREDTIKLLMECNSGIKMGYNSINNVIPYTQSKKLEKILDACKDRHAILGDKTHKALINNNGNTKAPHAFAQAMADMKVKAVVSFQGNDKAIASVMTDGCNMGIKSIYKYLNQYKNASVEAKEIANELISAEQELRTDLRKYL